MFGIITQLTQFVLLGRLLSAEEVGVASIVLVIVMFAQMFTDFGLSGYYVHRQKTSEEEKSTLYWLNIGLGSAIALFIALISPLISWFYQQDALINLLLICAISFPIIAAGSQLQASLLKKFAYKHLAIIEIIARTAALIAFTYTIYAGYGPSCVVAGHLVLCITKTFLLFIFSERSEYPSVTFEKKYVSGGLRFGGFLILGQFLNQITLNIDKLLIGKFLGMSSLGFYTLAKDLAMRSMQVVNPVVNKLCLPRYAAKQQDKSALAEEVGNTILILGFFSTLIFFSLSLVSSFVVELLYGPGKEEVVILLRVLAFYVLFRSFGNVIGSLLSALGETKLDFKWNVIASIIAIPSVYLLVHYDVKTMVLGMVTLQILFVFISYFVLLKPVLPLSFFTYTKRVFIFPLIGLVPFLYMNFSTIHPDIITQLIHYASWLLSYLFFALLLYKTPLKKYI